MPRADKYRILQSDLIEGLDEAATKANENSHTQTDRGWPKFYGTLFIVGGLFLANSVLRRKASSASQGAVAP